VSKSKATNHIFKYNRFLIQNQLYSTIIKHVRINYTSSESIIAPLKLKLTYTMKPIFIPKKRRKKKFKHNFFVRYVRE